MRIRTLIELESNLPNSYRVRHLFVTYFFSIDPLIRTKKINGTAWRVYFSHARWSIVFSSVFVSAKLSKNRLWNEWGFLCEIVTQCCTQGSILKYGKPPTQFCFEGEFEWNQKLTKIVSNSYLGMIYAIVAYTKWLLVFCSLFSVGLLLLNKKLTMGLNTIKWSFVTTP